jgi:hypothetical protein
MFVQRVLTRYELASATDPVRPGTIGLQFSAGGSATFTTKSGDTCTCTVVAGQEIETGPLASVGTVPAGTLGVVGR